MNNKYNYVVFDFDGVVCDSTNECMVTAWNAWECWNKRDGFRRSLNDFSQTEMDAFRPLRPYVRGADEYYILMRVINQTEKLIKNQKDFDEMRLLWADQLAPFKAIFFKERDRLRSEDVNNWIKLHEIYDDVIKVMKELHAQGRLLIATLKDGKSVRLILNRQGIDISLEEILDQSQISSKLEALDYFVAEKGINKEDICFIDDNVTHLIGPKNEDYKVFLSSWSHITSDHINIANKSKIPFININQINSLEL